MDSTTATTSIPPLQLPDINGLFASGAINETCKNKLIAIATKMQTNPLSLTAPEVTLVQQVLNGDPVACNGETGFSLSSVPTWAWILLALAVGYTVMSD